MGRPQARRQMRGQLANSGKSIKVANCDPHDWRGCAGSATICAANKECPPRSRKKSCSTPTAATPKIAAHASAILASSSFTGGAPTFASSTSGRAGAGRRLRSTLPVASIGSSSTRRDKLGIMYTGSFAFRATRTATRSSSFSSDRQQRHRPPGSERLRDHAL